MVWQLNAERCLNNIPRWDKIFKLMFGIEPMLFKCCAIVYDAGTTLKQYQLNPSKHEALAQCWDMV